MTTTIADVRAALVQCVETVPGLSGRGVAYPDDVVNPPWFEVHRKAMDPRTVFSEAKNTYVFAVILYADRTVPRTGQALIDTWCEPSGASSVLAAIQTSANWGTVSIDYAEVTQIGETQTVTVGGVDYLTVEIDVEVVW